MQLSARDKAAIQKVTRYADVMMNTPFEFSVRYGVVHFGKPGTTSHSEFRFERDAEAVEQYVARLAEFAWRRLSRKFGEGPAWHMLHPDIQVYRGENSGYRLRLREIMRECNMATHS